MHPNCSPGENEIISLVTLRERTIIFDNVCLSIAGFFGSIIDRGVGTNFIYTLSKFIE